jgi:hypothetical protein
MRQVHKQWDMPILAFIYWSWAEEDQERNHDKSDRTLQWGKESEQQIGHGNGTRAGAQNVAQVLPGDASDPSRV